MSLKVSSVILWILENLHVLLEKLKKREGKKEEEAPQSTSQPSQASSQPSQLSGSLLNISDNVFPYQTDPAFPEDVNKWGCALLCIAFIAWAKEGFAACSKQKIIERVLQVKRLALIKGYIDKELTILDYNKVFLLFGLLVEYTDKHEKPDRICSVDEEEMLYMLFEGTGHFVYGDGKGNIRFDPYSEQGSRTATYGKVVSKRIFKIKGRV